MSMAWIPKGDVVEHSASTQRGIYISPLIAKAYNRALEFSFQHHMEGKWPSHMVGSLPRRGTVDAIFATSELLRRSRAQKEDLAIILVDATAAFDHILVEPAFQLALDLGVPADLVYLLRLRLRGLSAVTAVDFAHRFVFLTKGVPQGTPSAASMFVLAAMSLDINLQHHDIADPTTPHEDLCLSIDSFSASTRRVYYVDDLASSRFRPTIKAVQSDLTAIQRCMKQSGVSISSKKTVVILSTNGKGSRSRKKKFGRFVQLSGSDRFAVVDHAKYLGVIMQSNSSWTLDTERRISLAKTALFRLSHVWRSSQLTMRTKVNLCSSLVLSVLTYGIQAKSLSLSNWIQLETFWSFAFRLAISDWASETHNSNIQIRLLYCIPSIHGRSRSLRMAFWRSVALDPSNHALAYCSFTSKYHWEVIDQSQPMLLLLQDDIKAYCTYHGLATPTCLDPVSVLLFLSTKSKSSFSFDLAFSLYDRSLNLRQYSAAQRTVQCPQCASLFFDRRGLSGHLRRTHRVQHPTRSLVTTNTCPCCKKTYTSIQGARQHFSNKCNQKMPAGILTALQARLSDIPVSTSRRRHARPSIPVPPLSVKHFFGKSLVSSSHAQK